MGDEKWRRRKPGSVSGTVVPPPVEEDPPPLPQRRTYARFRQSSDRRLPDAKPPGSGMPDAKLNDSKLTDAKLPDPQLPDNVRLLFQPVLRARDAGRGNAGSLQSNSGTTHPASRSGTQRELSHPVHGPALRDLARSGDQSASPANGREPIAHAPEVTGVLRRRRRQRDDHGA